MRHPAALSVLFSAVAALAPLSLTTAPTHAAVADDDALIRGTKVTNLRALSQRVTLDVRDQPISDIFDFIASTTGAELEPIYLDADSFEGIDPDTAITIKATNLPALSLLERVLSRAQQIERPASPYTWQFTDTGSIEFGPKAQLNRTRVVELYDISDLLFIVPRFEDAPEFDLSSALQASQSGGGGGQSPFQTAGQQTDDVSTEDRVEVIVNLIETTVEPDQWDAVGGDGASISSFGTSIVITAPDYVHRQINGYDFWPARLQQTRVIDGRREVRIRPDTRPQTPSNPARRAP